MSRSVARELAFKVLFQTDIGRNPWQQVLPLLSAEYNFSENEQAFLENLISGTLLHLSKIDQEILKYSPEWKLERMASTDRNIMRVALFELLFSEETPVSVAVNEAVELAKKYGNDDSGKFVNGILGNIIRGRTISATDTKVTLNPEEKKE